MKRDKRFKRERVKLLLIWRGQAVVNIKGDKRFKRERVKLLLI
jgi:hypothetical protein